MNNSFIGGRIPATLRAKLERAALRRNVSLGLVLREACERYVAREPDEPTTASRTPRRSTWHKPVA
jgi:hypothetical protein